MSELSKAQRAALAEVGRLTDKVGHANAYGHRLNTGVLSRLERAGLIASARPFAGSYHHVTITEAGRTALATDEAA